MEKGVGSLIPAGYDMKIEHFSEARANLPIALPRGRGFLVGTFDTAAFWRDAPDDLKSVAGQWFAAKEGGEGGRNTLLTEHLCRKMPALENLAEKLFRFEIVRATKRE